MSTSTPTQTPLRLPWRSLAAQLYRLGLVLCVVLLTLLGMAVAATAIQAGRDETRHVDVMLVLAPEIPPQALVTQTLEIYRRGYAAQVLLVGLGQSQVRSQLIDQGVPADAIGMAPPAPSTSGWLSGAVAMAGDGAALVVADPADLMIALKLAQDHGLSAYGAPPPGIALSPVSLLSAGLRYWGYVLSGSY